jgi:hypothetical protein
MMSDVEKATSSPETGRRSRRLALKTSMKSPEHDAQASTASDIPGPRRNPKRKSSQVSNSSPGLPDDLLAAAYEPVTDQERHEWEGWVELESDPVRVDSDDRRFDAELTSAGLIQSYPKRARYSRRPSPGALLNRSGVFGSSPVSKNCWEISMDLTLE